MKIIEYEDKYLEDVKDLLVKLEEYIVSIDEDELDSLYLARTILEEAIDILDIEAPVGASEKKYNYLDRKYATIPDVVNMTLKEAMSNLKGFKVEYTGSGSKVIYQSPAKNTRIYEGETVKLMLGE